MALRAVPRPLAAVVALCVMAAGAGCAADEDIPPDEPQRAGGAFSREDAGGQDEFARSYGWLWGAEDEADPDPANGMESVTITIVDVRGEPVPNLVVNLEYAGGKEGPFTPGDGLTDLDGAVRRRAYPAQYNLYVSDRKMLDYTGATLRNQMVFSLSVAQDADNDRRFVWEHPTPGELDRQSEDKLTLRFVDGEGAPLPGLLINLVPEDAGEGNLRQLIPGYTDPDGSAYCALIPPGRYALGAMRRGEEGAEWDSFAFELTEDRREYEFVWTSHLV